MQDVQARAQPLRLRHLAADADDLERDSPAHMLVDDLEERVVAGAPGHFTPDYARIPGNLSELNSLGALGQTTAWTSGQHVVLGDRSEAHWNGTTWVSDRAP